MSLEQTDKIDFISIDKTGENVVLTISDHLTWEDSFNHQLLLQEKLNSYIAFYESDQIFEAYPLAKGKSVVIEVVGKVPLNQDGLDFFKRANEVINELGIVLRFKQIAKA